MGFFDDRIIGDDPSDFRHSKRPSLRYLLKSHDQLMEEELRALEAQLERRGGPFEREEGLSNSEDVDHERE